MLLPSGVSSAREASCAASASSSTVTPGGRKKLGGLAISQGDGPGLVEEQDVHVPCRFDRTAAHGQHVLLDHAVDPRDPDGAEQAADGRGNQADQQGHQHGDRKGHAGVKTEGFQGDDDDQEDDRHG